MIRSPQRRRLLRSAAAGATRFAGGGPPSLGDRSLVLGLVGLLLFSGYGAFLPASVRCAWPGAVGCRGGLLPFVAPSPSAAGQQWFNVVTYDYGFWVTDTVSGANDSSSWPVYEGWTVNVNVTSLPPNPSVGGVNQHGVGIDISGSGTVLDVAGPVGSWNHGSFVAPNTPSTGNRVYCTIYCGPGHSSQVVHILNVVPAPNVPTATASGAPSSGPAPLNVGFTGSASGGSAPYTYLWNFGDGSSGSTSSAPQHVYNLSGSYAVKLAVTDAAGASATASTTITVLASAPLVVTASGAPLSGAAPLPVTFSASATGGATPYAWLWDFGDGSSGVGASVAHLYDLPGTFVASVRAVDAAGATTAATVLVNVTAAGPALAVTASAASAGGAAPFGASLSVSATGGTAPYNVTWDLGDGSVAWGTSVAHTYTAQGTYVATARVRDAGSSAGISTTTLTVSGTTATPLGLRLGPTPSVSASPCSLTVGGSLSGGRPPYLPLTWSFGDGSTGTGSVVSHTYAVPGTYTLSASGQDSTGATTTASTVLVVAGVGLHLVLSRAQGDAPATLNASASVFGGSGAFGPISWSWGDGSASTGPIVSHLYPGPGASTYGVVATAYDSAGTKVSNSTSFQLFAPLSVTLNASVSAATPPAQATFTLKASGGSGTYPTGILWSFGDGTSTRSGTTSSDNYTKAGSYHVTASVVDSAGGVALGSTWVNLSVAGALPPGGSGPGGPSGPSPPPWLGNGVGDPTQTSLVLIFLMSAAALALVLQGRRRRLARRGGRPPIRGGPGSSSTSPSSPTPDAASTASPSSPTGPAATKVGPGPLTVEGG